MICFFYVELLSRSQILSKASNLKDFDFLEIDLTFYRKVARLDPCFCEAPNASLLAHHKMSAFKADVHFNRFFTRKKGFLSRRYKNLNNKYDEINGQRTCPRLYSGYQLAYLSATTL